MGNKIRAFKLIEIVVMLFCANVFCDDASSISKTIEILNDYQKVFQNDLFTLETELHATQEEIKRIREEAEKSFNENPDPSILEDIRKKYPKIKKGDMCEFSDVKGNVLKGKLIAIVKGKYFVINQGKHDCKYPWSVLPPEISEILLGDYEEFVFRRARFDYVSSKLVQINSKCSALAEKYEKAKIAYDYIPQFTYKTDVIEEITWFDMKLERYDIPEGGYTLIRPYLGIKKDGYGLLRIYIHCLHYNWLFPKTLIIKGDETTVRIDIEMDKNKQDILNNDPRCFESCDVWVRNYLDDLLKIASSKKIIVRLEGHSSVDTYEMTNLSSLQHLREEMAFRCIITAFAKLVEAGTIR